MEDAHNDRVVTDRDSGELTRRIDELHALVESQSAILEAQRDVIESLRLRVEHLDVAGDLVAPLVTAESPPAGGAGDGAPTDLVTSRRALLRKGTAAAAGAAIVGTALSVAAAPPAAAASGTFDGNPAVTGTANPTSGLGVSGISSTGTGVMGSGTALSGNNRGVFGTSNSTTGTGVRGENLVQTGGTRGVAGYVSSDAGVAVSGVAGSATGAAKGVSGTSFSTAGIGVYGEATSANGVGISADALAGTALQAQSGRTHLRFGGAPQPPLGAGLARTRGELVFDTNGDLWLCIGAGTPGTWRRVSGTNTAGALRVLASTIRIYDSRAGEVPLGVVKGKFADHGERPISATLGGAVPAGATAVLINATATNTNPGGFFAFFKNGIAWPENSSLSWGVANATIANLAVVAVDAAASFKARMEGAGGADLVIDCIGYYQ